MTQIPIEEPGRSDSPSPGPDDQPPAPGGDSNEMIKLRTERDQLYERLARASAEFKNAQKRIETENLQRIQYANSSLIKALLPAVDNFDRALAQDPARVDSAAILKGMQIVYDQLWAVLRSQSVEEISPRVGDPFDPTRHEAVMQQPSDQYSEPTVTSVFEKGYTLAGQRLRPAKVAVSKVE